MRKYQDSDYAVNKYSNNIVYRFANKTVEVSLEDFLQDNPDKTEQDFINLKALSDDIYYEQDRADTRYGKRARTLESIENVERFAVVSPDEEFIHKFDEGQAIQAAKSLLESGDLTETQRRRFILHFFKGLSYRKIAMCEGVFFTSVAESVTVAVAKLQKIYKNI